MPKVSIIVPNYNYARFLSQRLDSIARQTFRDFEVILLDDASTDESVEVLQEFARRHSGRLIVNDTNSGTPFAQWNKGLKVATGQYVWIAEADDCAAERFLEILVRRLDENPECGLAYCNSFRIDDAGAVGTLVTMDTYELDLNHWGHDFIANGREECIRFLVQENTIPNASAVVFRRELYEAVGQVDEALRLTGDWKFWASLLRISDVAFVAEPLNYFRTHQTSVRSRLRVWMHVEETFRVMKYILDSMTFPPEAVKNVHTRAAVLLLHAMVTEPNVTEFKRSLALASDFGFRFSLRSSYGLIRQTITAVGRRLSQSADRRRNINPHTASSAGPQ